MTTERRRWKVWKQQRWAPKPCWVVTSPEYHEAAFDTHAEALAFANCMAYIAEVTLPQVSSTITADLQAIALALLAHHYRNQTP